MIYLTSDNHFFHKKICDYEARPFNNVEEMNREMVKIYNNTINNRDIVYFLGDVSFSNKENTQRIIQNLKGRKILIAGNHDKQRSQAWWRDCGFDEVIYYPIIIETWFILSHEPIEYINDSMPYVNLYGHVHGDTRYKTVDKHGVCCCVERHQYKPISLDWIRSELKIIRNGTVQNG